MKEKALARYVCPVCGGGPFRLSGGRRDRDGGEIVEGILGCPACEASFPVADGVPRFAPGGRDAASFGFQWTVHRRTQLDSVTGLPLSRERLFETTGWPVRMDGQTVLEAGSGAGRFTEVLLATGAEVYSFDYSEAVDANRENNGDHANLHLFQGDIFRIPLREAVFDKVICLGVLQHTPDPGTAFRRLSRHVRPGGELVVDVYARRLSALVSWKYALRPLTKKMGREPLYRLVEALVPMMLPLAAFLRRVAGRAGARLLPVVEYSHLELPDNLKRQWAILDTFDMYSPAHDHPQSRAAVREWFLEEGFADVVVRDGRNGVVGKGRKPSHPGPSAGGEAE